MPTAPTKRARGAEVIKASVEDMPSLRAAFLHGKRAFLLNPPADTTTGGMSSNGAPPPIFLRHWRARGLKRSSQRQRAARSPEIASALSTSFGHEEGLRQQSIPMAINWGAYYISNWDGLLDVVRRDGALPAMFPEDAIIPMVAPVDVGHAAAERLSSCADDIGVW